MTYRKSGEIKTSLVLEEIFDNNMECFFKIFHKICLHWLSSPCYFGAKMPAT